MRADMEKDPAEVSAMFDRVAPRYDLANTVLSFGIAPLWRAALTRSLALQPSQQVLDVACGTGTSSVALANSGATVVGVDFSDGMISAAYPKAASHPNLTFQVADATKMPFADASFDVVTISFGLRNVHRVDAALAEFLRVLRPGGRLLISEFSTPPNKVWRALYGFHLHRIAPLMAKVVSSNDSAYGYLVESIDEWPNQQALASHIRAAGFESVQWRNLTGGIVAMHRAVKPTVQRRPSTAAKKSAAAS